MAHSERYLQLLGELDRFSLIVPMPIDSAWVLLQKHYVIASARLLQTVRACAQAGYMELQKIQYNPNFVQEMQDLHIRKNAGYSGLQEDPWFNFRQVERFDITTQDGIIARLTDKYQRYINLRANPELDKVQESITDTLQDFVAYCLILYCIIEEDNNR